MREYGNSTVRTQNREALVAYFESGCQRIDGFGKLGVEVEHIVLMQDGTPVAYEPSDDAPGIREVLEHLRTWYPTCAYNGEGDLLGLLGEDGSVTLEPAAQLELSAAPHERIEDIRRAYQSFRDRVATYLSSRGAVLVSGGYHPTRKAQELTLIPKRRYAFMNEYFALIGSHGDRMMRASASTQVSVDFSDEADAVRKMRVAAALAPVLAAIADNTQVFERATNHTPIRRLQLWREVDPLRCGTVPGIFDEGFGFDSYAEWLLSTPPIFVTRPAADNPQGDRLRAMYKTAADEAYADAPMEKDDVEHLMSMFWPDVRLKRFVEIRPADCMPLPQVLGYAALIKGLFYSEASLAAIEGTLGVEDDRWPLSSDDVSDAITSIQAHGFEGEVYGRKLAYWEDTLFSLARETLPKDEAAYLSPLEEFAHDKPWWR